MELFISVAGMTSAQDHRSLIALGNEEKERETEIKALHMKMRNKNEGREQSPTSEKIRERADDPAAKEDLNATIDSTRDEDLESITAETDHLDGGLEELQEEELTGSQRDEKISSANYSDTDEDEDEGLGDGNLGRTVR